MKEAFYERLRIPIQLVSPSSILVPIYGQAYHLALET